jgi:hypothetical protein
MPPLPMLRNELKSLEAMQVAPPGRFLVKSVLAISRFDFRPCIRKAESSARW